MTRAAMQQILSSVLPPILTLVVGLVLWHFAVTWFQIPKVLLPAPNQVAQAAWENRVQLLAATGLTATAALSGFAISLLLGTSVSMLFSQSSMLRAGLFPYAIFLQTVPIIAIAPLIVIWLGEGFMAVVTISCIISLFPMITNGTTGMLSFTTAQDELFRLNKATAWQKLWKLQFPGALPHLVTGAAHLQWIVGAGCDRG